MAAVAERCIRVINERLLELSAQTHAYEIRVLALEGDGLDTRRLCRDGETIEQSLRRAVNAGDLHVDPICLRIDITNGLQSLRQQLEWARVRVGRFIVIASCPSHVGENANMHEDVEQMCRNHGNVFLMFGRQEVLHPEPNSSTTDCWKTPGKRRVLTLRRLAVFALALLLGVILGFVLTRISSTASPSGGDTDTPLATLQYEAVPLFGWRSCGQGLEIDTYEECLQAAKMLGVQPSGHNVYQDRKSFTFKVTSTYYKGRYCTFHWPPGHAQRFRRRLVVSQCRNGINIRRGRAVVFAKDAHGTVVGTEDAYGHTDAHPRHVDDWHYHPGDIITDWQFSTSCTFEPRCFVDQAKELWFNDNITPVRGASELTNNTRYDPYKALCKVQQA
eukprot:TRINITY_DN21933_c0_g3_i1.p1 TRINITY_DN21933_c0_g3~~TRINITY_DN21933_c0_g3_i1.p1  ORF type:complete len:389 (-),score=20.49 TRINITY_DN21933_c0_g3_i1:84-1250(-)